MDQSLEARLEALEQVVRRLAERVEELDARREPAPRPTAPAPRQQPDAPAGARDAEQTDETPAWRANVPDVGALDLETLLGGRVLAWLGGLAILLGVVFFLVMAVSRGWIDEPTRVVLAFLGSTALLVVGLYLYERRGQTEAAVAAVASAVAALYASLVAATQLYDLISPVLGLGVAALVGATSTAIAVRWSSPLVGALGILGALLSPVLVDAEESGVTLAFVALALVSAVAVLLWQRWNWLASAAFLVSVPQLLLWLEDEYEERLALSLAVLLLFWALYVVAAIGYELRVPTAGLRAASAVLLLGNALFAAGAGYFMLQDTDHESVATAWVILLALAHLALGVFGFRARISNEIGALLVAVALGLSAVGLALALEGPALVAGWSAEAAVLAWAARRTGDRRAYIGSFVFLTLALGHILAFEAPLDSLRNGVDDLPSALVSLLVFAIAALLVARFYEGDPREARLVLEAAGAAALVYLPSVAIVEAVGVHDDGRPRQAGQVWLSAFWALLGLTGVVFGLVRDDRRFRLAGLALLGIAVVKVFLYDLSELEELYRVLSFIALGLLLLAGAFAYGRIRTTAREEEPT